MGCRSHWTESRFARGQHGRCLGHRDERNGAIGLGASRSYLVIVEQKLISGRLPHSRKMDEALWSVDER